MFGMTQHLFVRLLPLVELHGFLFVVLVGFFLILVPLVFSFARDKLWLGYFLWSQFKSKYVPLKTDLCDVPDKRVINIGGNFVRSIRGKMKRFLSGIMWDERVVFVISFHHWCSLASNVQQVSIRPWQKDQSAVSSNVISDKSK